MKRPGHVVEDNGVYDMWAGGVGGEYGDVLVGMGPEGVAVAACFARGSYGGFLKSVIFVPFLAMFVVGLLFPASVYFRLHLCVLGYLSAARRKRRSQRGLCPSCGYDVFGNLSGVCPECGGTIDGQPVGTSTRPPS